MKPKPPRLKQAVVLKRLTAAWEEALASGLQMDRPEARRCLKEASLATSGEELSGKDAARLLIASTRVVLMGSGVDGFKRHASKIKTEKDLERVIAEIRGKSAEIPQAFRKAMKMVSGMLPRKGGPGRQPKLSAAEASRACDHIATFIRQKNSLKVALQKTSNASLSLFGKKVSARTLQKAWDNRDTLISN